MDHGTLIVAMFALGLWMVTLNYYSPTTAAPDIHRSVGTPLLFLLALRVAARQPEAGRRRVFSLRARGGQIVHWGFYPLLFALMARAT